MNFQTNDDIQGVLQDSLWSSFLTIVKLIEDREEWKCHVYPEQNLLNWEEGSQ